MPYEFLQVSSRTSFAQCCHGFAEHSRCQEGRGLDRKISEDGSVWIGWNLHGSDDRDGIDGNLADRPDHHIHHDPDRP